MICQICVTKSYISFFQTYTNFDNQAERKVDRNVPRKKPLMYFCFDLLEDQSSTPDQFQTVAVTCPKKKLTKEPKITKCCPHGQVLDNASENCVGEGQELGIEDKWRLQINGHLYRGYEGPLHDKEILVPYNVTNSSQNFWVRVQEK